MGASQIQDIDLINLGVEIVGTKPDGDRTLKIPEDNIEEYKELIRSSLDNGFWNDIVGEKEIIFIFKFKDGSIKEYILSDENEVEVSKLCSDFSGESEDKTANVRKFISGNSFYKDFMNEYYSDILNK
jgi:hypothetical protein